MAVSSAQAVKELREMTGLGMMECKKILEEAGGDAAKAKELARKRGQEKVAKAAERVASEGIIEYYMHHNNKVAALVELNCNTDFVARNEAFRQLAKDLALHIAAMRPLCVRREELDPDTVNSIKAHFESEVPGNKPASVIEKIVDGKMKSWYSERVLLDQPFAKDDSKTIGQMVDEVIGKTKENVRIARFARFEVGETGKPEDAPAT